jgi:endonuclease III
LPISLIAGLSVEIEFIYNTLQNSVVKSVLNKQQIRHCLDEMGELFPNAHCELVHSNPFELVIAVALSAQCTDALVNKVTKDLFQKYKTPEDFLSVPLEELQQDIRSIGLYRNKAKNIQMLCRLLIDEYNGVVPTDRDELTRLPGVGRKTANVVVSVAFGVPAIAVDTHVERVSKRLAFCRWKDSVLEVEKTLMKKIPKDEWSITHHRMIFFGRYHCKAQNPKCESCPLLDVCREGKKRMRSRA